MNNPYINQNTNQNQSLTPNLGKNINEVANSLPFVPENFNTAGFLKGALIGAGIAYILSNEKAQHAIFKAIVKASDMLRASTEELKERFEDVKAELADQE